MNHRLWTALGLLCQLAQLGCASSLDFDSVAAGRHATDAGESLVDAGSTKTALRTVPSDVPAPMEDAGVPALPQSTATLARPAIDAGHVVAKDAGTSDAAQAAQVAEAADPSAFSCATLRPKPWFCDDFEGLGLRGHWSDVGVEPTDPLPGGSIDIDATSARAGKSSLVAQVDEGLRVCSDCVIAVFAGMTLQTLQGPSKLTAEFDVRVEQVDVTEGRRIAIFQLWWGAPELGFTQHTLQLGSSGGSLWTGLVEMATDPRASDSPVNTTMSDHQWQQLPLLSQWVHVVYALDVQDALGTANVARLTVGDVVLFDGPLSLALRNGKASLEIGVPWLDTASFGADDTSQPWRVRYDNVVVRHEPR